MMRHIGSIAVGCVLVAVGIAGGWYSARQGAGAPAAADDHEEPGLSAQALKNLGVTTGEARLGKFVRYAKVQAIVIDAPLNSRPIATPLGGIVTELHVRPGQVVAAGAPLLSIARSPIPRPQLALTADILTTVSENLHEAIGRLRSASAQHRIVSMELARVRKFTETGTAEGLPVLPRKTLIDLEYDLVRAQQEKENAERELERHGLSRAEIEAVREGASPPGYQRLWKRALEQNGLWGDTEAAILETLPAREHDLPWSIAAIGELSAAGLATPALAGALREDKHLAEHFVDVASLILDGNTVAKVGILAKTGALEPIMVLAAPGGSAPDWDVANVDVRVGRRVEAGDAVALLHDARRMWLRLEPVGEELGHVAGALERGTELDAVPLIDGAGPKLAGLRIDRLETRAREEERGAVAFVVCPNEPLGGNGGSRSWRLRVGLRYLVRVPVEELDERFVLPASAVTEMGPEKVVFLQDGKTFAPRPVHVEYEDDEVAVIAHDGSLFPGDPVVMTGAFALGLALQTGSGAVDPHAGHQH